MIPQLPEASSLHLKQRLAMLDQAQVPSVSVLWKKANTLYLLDRFDEALELCDQLAPRMTNPSQELLYANVLWALKTDETQSKAEAILQGLLEREGLASGIKAESRLVLADIYQKSERLDLARPLLMMVLDQKHLTKRLRCLRCVASSALI